MGSAKGGSCIIKFFMDEGMKNMEIIDNLSKPCGGDALLRTQVCHWMEEVKSGRKGLSNIPLPERASNKGLDDCIGKALNEESRFSTKKIAKAMNIGSMTVRNQLAKSLGMKYHDM
jgi:hypothetical protein